MAAASAKVASVFRTGLFDGKVAIVTGGGTGIGKAITQELLYLGWYVFCRITMWRNSKITKGGGGGGGWLGVKLLFIMLHCTYEQHVMLMHACAISPLCWWLHKVSEVSGTVEVLHIFSVALEVLHITSACLAPTGLSIYLSIYLSVLSVLLTEYSA